MLTALLHAHTGWAARRTKSVTCTAASSLRSLHFAGIGPDEELVFAFAESQSRLRDWLPTLPSMARRDPLGEYMASPEGQVSAMQGAMRGQQAMREYVASLNV